MYLGLGAWEAGAGGVQPGRNSSWSGWLFSWDGWKVEENVPPGPLDTKIREDGASTSNPNENFPVYCLVIERGGLVRDNTRLVANSVVLREIARTCQV